MEVSHVQAGTAAAPGDVVAPAPTPQTQNVAQTTEKQLADQRQPFLSFQAPLCLRSEVPEVAALLPGVSVLTAFLHLQHYQSRCIS